MTDKLKGFIKKGMEHGKKSYAEYRAKGKAYKDVFEESYQHERLRQAKILGKKKARQEARKNTKGFLGTRIGFDIKGGSEFAARSSNPMFSSEFHDKKRKR